MLLSSLRSTAPCSLQVVLELLETNVNRGSAVYEVGHILVLGYCRSQRDLEAVWKLLQQLCLVSATSMCSEYICFLLVEQPKTEHAIKQLVILIEARGNLLF